MAVTYTFENIVINGVDTSKTYNASNLPVRGVTRIICNGTDRLHKNVNTDLPYQEAPTSIKVDFTTKYARDVLALIDYYTSGISISLIMDGTYTVTGFDLTFDVPAKVYVDIHEDDPVAGGWVAYDTIDWNNVTTLSVRTDETTNSITFASNKGTVTYTRSASYYELGVYEFNLTVKGRAY